MRLELQRKMDTHDPRVTPDDTKRLMDMSNALVRAVVALQKVSHVAEELSKRLTPEELLEAAIKKIEGQDIKFVEYAIKRLRLVKSKVAKAAGEGAPGASAAEAIASLGE
jgi:ABC-type phosphate transport system auxiliary subunit